MVLLEPMAVNERNNVHVAQGELLTNRCPLLHPNQLIWNLAKRQYTLP